MSNTFETLTDFPFHAGLTRPQVAQAERARFHALLHRLRWLVPGFALRIGDRMGKKWLDQTCTIYTNETAALAEILGAGAYTLNTGYEWCCTTFVRPDENGMPVMHRTLDWSLAMADFMHVAEYQTPHGPYYDINWPGNSGMINGIAPGRFVIAINQAPIPMHLGIGKIGSIPDWIIQRRKTFNSRDWPPTHLLRHVFESAPDYQTACRMLEQTPLAIPVIFTVCGAAAGEARVIERMETAAHVITDNVCTANHWQNPNWRGHARPIKSRARLKTAKAAAATKQGFDWLQNPILNKHSIMAFRAATGGTAEIITLAYKHGLPTPARYLSIQIGKP